MEKIKLKQAVIVEGKYDKIALSQLIDGVIITTDGFGIYSNPEIVRLIRFYAENGGIVILTDSDSAGQQIRGKIKSIINSGEVINVYCPVIFGKEKRKLKASKEGKLGVEGMSIKVLREAFEKAGLIGEREVRQPVTKNDFIMLGLSGSKDSSARREALALALDLPKELSANALRDAVSTLFGREAFINYYEQLLKEEENG